MTTIFQIELDIPAERAWVAVGEKFGDTGLWTSFLDSSYMEGEVGVGGQRVCVQGKKKLTEHLTKYDPQTMTLEYELIGGRPAIVKFAGNRWTVVPLGSQRSKLTMSPTSQLRWWALPLAPVMSLVLRAILPKVLEEFKCWAETGELHPRKKAKTA
ncbi:MAG: SRPBCC family protein [Kordiimonadaceae bacterium]|nr:SRPBCC family protein [Kordiimonadaceae bacterium]